MASNSSNHLRIKVNLMGYRHLTGLKHDAVIDIKIRKELRDFNALTKPGEGIEEERRASENAESLAKVQKEIEDASRAAEEAAAVAEEEFLQEKARRIAEKAAFEQECLRIAAKKAAEEAAAAAEQERLIEAARRAKEEDKILKEDKEKQAAEEAERKALEEARKEEEDKWRKILEKAVKTGNKDQIKTTLHDVKEAGFAELQKDIEDAERVLDTIEAGEKLRDAMSRRHLGDVEAAVNKIKKMELEKEYALELIEADKLMNKLRRLERLRREILELNQSTISEIRSYQKPPEAVHQVMIAVYLLLGYEEEELMEWKNMQALIGRMGKESLKRLIASLQASDINQELANYSVEQYLSKTDLISMREASEGAAVFYVWALSMTEEAQVWCAEKGELSNGAGKNSAPASKRSSQSHHEQANRRISKVSTRKTSQAVTNKKLSLMGTKK